MTLQRIFRAGLLGSACAGLVGCQSDMKLDSNAFRGDTPAGVEMIIAGVRSRNPDQAELCRKGFNHIRHEVTVVATELVVSGRLSSAVLPDGAKATRTIHGNCLRG